jgi:hypothetical protein
MSRTLTRGGRFSGVHWWPVLGVHRGLAGRVRVFAQVHADDFRGLLKAMLGFDSKWSSRAESSKYRKERLSHQIPGAPRNVCGLRVGRAPERVYFSGFFWRMIGDQARPSDLIAVIALDHEVGSSQPGPSESPEWG